MFEYVVSDIRARTATAAIEQAKARVKEAGLILNHVKRVSEKPGPLSWPSYTVVMVVRSA